VTGRSSGCRLGRVVTDHGAVERSIVSWLFLVAEGDEEKGGAQDEDRRLTDCSATVNKTYEVTLLFVYSNNS